MYCSEEPCWEAVSRVTAFLEVVHAYRPVEISAELLRSYIDTQIELEDVRCGSNTREGDVYWFLLRCPSPEAYSGVVIGPGGGPNGLSEAVARNPGCSPDTLHELRMYPRCIVHVAHNLSTREDTLEEVVQIATRGGNTEGWRGGLGLAPSGEWRNVLNTAIMNPNVPESLLCRLWDEGDDVLRAGIVRHANASEAHREYGYRSADPYMRVSAMLSPHASSEYLYASCTDPAVRVRKLMAGDDRATAEMLGILAEDMDPDVLWRVAQRDDISDEVLLRAWTRMKKLATWSRLGFMNSRASSRLAALLEARR